MKLNTIIISQDLSKKLYHHNVRAISCFYWYQEKLSDDLQLFKTDMTQLMMPWKYCIGKPSKDNQNIHLEYSAYTSSELGEMLPNPINHNGRYYHLLFLYNGKEWEYFYRCRLTHIILTSVTAQTEQDARAMLLIDILEKGYIDVSQTIIK